jgi:hypothetical protein
VSASGTITTAAGTGTAGFAGDSGPATGARLNLPIGVAFTASGAFLIADTSNQRVRLVDAAEAAPPPPPTEEPPSVSDPLTLADLPKPRLGRTLNVQAVKGRVLVAVGRPRAAAAGVRAGQKRLRFVPLEEARQIPIGSFLDTKRGTVRMVTATGRRGRTQRGDFSAGLFQVLQSRRKKARGLTVMRLKGDRFRSCRRGRRAGQATAARLSRRTIRRLRGRARGRFRIRGRHSAATVRGTIWLTADRCDGTLTKVRRGKVAVRDFRRRRTVLVEAGRSYLARAPR